MNITLIHGNASTMTHHIRGVLERATAAMRCKRNLSARNAHARNANQQDMLHGFMQLHSDGSTFHGKRRGKIILGTHVDDIVVCAEFHNEHELMSQMMCF